MLDLNIIWFLLIGVLFVGYFILEGFDFGVGILLPFLGKDDLDRRIIINTIGPFWDGNEVWLITAGGAMFAAFPNWYATLFSSFYVPLFFILVALIFRGVAIEFRSKEKHPSWRKTWDTLICLGSAGPAILWGVAFTNLVRGIPIDATRNYAGTLWDLLNPVSLAGGVLSLALFLYQGALFLELKTTESVRARALKTAKMVWPVAFVLIVALLIGGYYGADYGAEHGWGRKALPLATGAVMLVAGLLTYRGKIGWAFAASSITIALASTTAFAILFPHTMISSLNPEWSMTIYNSSSTPYTLKIMTVVALIFVPIVSLYHAWTYWVFRQRVTRKSSLEI